MQFNFTIQFELLALPRTEEIIQFYDVILLLQLCDGIAHNNIAYCEQRGIMALLIARHLAYADKNTLQVHCRRVYPPQ